MKYIRINSAANANLQNIINTSIIFHYLRNNGASYRFEISKALKLSLPAVSRAVNLLLEKKVLTEKRIITETGKKAHEVQINASLGLCVGICIELPIVKFSRMDMAGNILDFYETSLSPGTDDIHKFIIEQLKLYLGKTYAHDSMILPVLAVCLSLPMAIDQSHNTVHAVLFKRIKAMSLRNDIAAEMGIPVLIENNENLAALAEKYYKEGTPEDCFAFITVHQGMGAGLIINGLLHTGSNGAAGEVGCQRLVDTRNGRLASPDIYENQATIDRIQKIAVELIQEGRGEEIFHAANYDYNSINHILIGELANSGSAEALQVLEIYAKVLAIGLSNLLVIVNPETLVLGGDLRDIVNAENLVVEPLRKALEPLLPFPVPKIRLTRLGREAAVIGAAQYALENTIYGEYPYILE